MQSVLVVNDLEDVDDVGLEDHACHNDLVQYVVHLEGEGGREGRKSKLDKFFYDQAI